MIAQQIMPWHVPERAILQLIAEVPREHFMPAPYQNLALAELSIPLAHGQITMSPTVEARLLQALNIKPTDKILEVGTGSAYLTALLAKSGRQVVSVDIYPEFIDEAGIKLDRQAIHNVSLECGNGAHGWPQSAPYDVIVLTGSVPALEGDIKRQLDLGGRLFAVIGTSPVMHATLITRIADRDWYEKILFETELPALENIAPEELFRF